MAKKTEETEVGQVLRHVRKIPKGRVSSYGQIGARCEPPISGFMVGRILGRKHPKLPWWRVVAKDGSFPVGRRDPELAFGQREMLEEEGVGFLGDGRVDMGQFG